MVDKGYHSNDVVADLTELGFRTYASEPDRGRRRWKNNHRARDAVYANRRRMKSGRGQALRKKRSEIAERSNAHCYETGGMRRVHVRRRDNVAKRVLIQAATYNLALIMRVLLGAGTPKGLAGRLSKAVSRLWDPIITHHALAAIARRILVRIDQLMATVRGHAAIAAIW